MESGRFAESVRGLERRIELDCVDERGPNGRLNKFYFIVKTAIFICFAFFLLMFSCGQFNRHEITPSYPVIECSVVWLPFLTILELLSEEIKLVKSGN